MQAGSLRLAVVSVVSLVVHNELVVHEVEAVGLGFERVADDILLLLWGQVGHVVDRFPGVGGVGDAESEAEIERFDELPSEVVTLDHAEVGDSVGSYGENELGPNGLVAEELRAESVTNGASGNIHFGGNRLWGRKSFTLTLDVEDYGLGFHIADGELQELDAVDVVGQAAEEPVGWGVELEDLIRGNIDRLGHTLLK